MFTNFVYYVPSLEGNLIRGFFYYVMQIESLSLTFHGHDLIVDSELELNYGR